MKKGDAESPIPFNFLSVYAIKIVKESQEGLKLNGTRQNLIRIGGVNLLGGYIITVKQASTNPGRLDIYRGA